MNNYAEELKNIDALFKPRYNVVMINNFIDLCFESLNPTQARFNEATDLKIANCFMKFSESLKRIE